MALIERAGPYGQGNPQPRFAFPAHRVKFAKVVGEAHVRCTLEAGDGSRLDAIAFRAADQPLGDLLLSSAGMPLHVAGICAATPGAAATAASSSSRTPPTRAGRAERRTERHGRRSSGIRSRASCFAGKLRGVRPKRARAATGAHVKRARC